MNLFNKYLRVYSRPVPTLVAGDLTGEKSGHRSLFYIPKLGSGKGNSLFSQFLEDELMAKTGTDFTWVQLSFSKHLQDAKHLFHTVSLHLSHVCDVFPLFSQILQTNLGKLNI